MSAFSDHGDPSQTLEATWWQAFEVPELNKLVEAALQNNFDLRSAWDRMAQAEAQARLAGVDLHPTLTFEAGARPIQTGTGGLNAVNGNYNLGVFAAYELDLWGRIRARADASLMEMDARGEDVRAAAISLAAELSLRYFELVAFVAERELLRQQKSSNENILKILRAQFLNGDGRVADVLRQENLVEQTEGDLVLVSRDIQLRATQISVLLGRGPLAWQVEQLTRKALPTLSSVAHIGVPAEVLRRRPDIRAAYLRVQSADQDLASAIADLYPRLSLSARGETRGESADIFSNWLFSLAGNIVQPIFDGGRRRATVEQNRAEVSEAINLYSQASLNAFREVEAALIEESELERFRTSLELRTRKAITIFEQLRESYLNRQSAFLDVLAAQTTLQNLQRELIRTNRDLIAARIALMRASAGAPELVRPKQRENELLPARGLNVEQQEETSHDGS